MTGIGASFSVKYLAQYKANVLVTFDESQPFSNRILAYFAEAPTGPFRHATPLYQAPEAGGGRWVYNARLHLEQSAGGATAVVSYNVNSFDPDERSGADRRMAGASEDKRGHGRVSSGGVESDTVGVQHRAGVRPSVAAARTLPWPLRGR
jgi:hypothetical protein